MDSVGAYQRIAGDLDQLPVGPLLELRDDTARSTAKALQPVRGVNVRIAQTRERYL
jgi:hypothetical protein